MRTFTKLVVVMAVLMATRLAVAQRGPMNVAVCPVLEDNLPPTVRLVGDVLADRRSVVASEVAGIVSAFDPREGRFLKAGELICQLDAGVVQLQLDEARARLDALTEALRELEAGERAEEIRRLEAVESESQAIFDKWAFERERIDRLFKKNQASDKEMHDTDMEFLAAKLRLAQGKAALEMARNGARKEVIARARHDVAAQKAVVARFERDLAKTAIRAPFDGFLVTRETEVGEWLPSGGAVGTLVALDRVRLRVRAPEEAVPFAQPGQPARVEIPALQLEQPATVTRLIPAASESARTFPLEVEVENPEHRILPGMFVWVSVPSGPPGTRLLVSKDAIVPRGLQKTIFVVRGSPDGAQMAVPMTVETGLEKRGLIEVRAAGLAPGDSVVCRANERLFGPTPVMPVPLEQFASQGSSGG